MIHQITYSLLLLLSLYSSFVIIDRIRDRRGPLLINLVMASMLLFAMYYNFRIIAYPELLNSDFQATAISSYFDILGKGLIYSFAGYTVYKVLASIIKFKK